MPVAKPAPISPGLSGVSETMLWSLYNRASEARRPDAVLDDAGSIRIQDAIDYDFAGQFGPPAGSLAVRAAAIDRELRAWLVRHPHGLVVSLGEGLETQSRRVDNGTMRWLSVDLPAAISLREKFLPASDRFSHLAASALDPAWMDAVDASRGVFIVAQGLLMYLQPAMVRDLLCGIADRFPAADVVFDVIPRWFSQLTRLGLRQSPRYRLPPMPWGIDRGDIAGTLRGWHRGLFDVRFLDYAMPRGLPLLLANVARATPLGGGQLPSLVHVVLSPESSPRDVPHEDRSGRTLGSVMALARHNACSGHDLATAMAGAQRRLAAECFRCATAGSIAMGTFALHAHEAAMVPVRQAVAANAERLGF